ncbi:MAG TPA: 2,3-bisphosphoglycerate-dependent phosphoglycerate mutase [Agriterribacter sp.]|nr:2,3-bisphosphoglycerate-dependent phosphoglycerate mutase [Agriterribacter sp.]HRQ51391.1 2,3-bisphosphoglycerate-dependent phosphoglycerate mutase [Agriterribacter sp.]
MPLLVIVRHGQSQWNLENRFTGNRDVPLTALGREEAHIAGKKLGNIVFDHAFTSLLERAVETLTIILGEIEQLQVPVIKNSALNERDYGTLQGMNKAEVAEKYGAKQVELWRRSYDLQPPGGESLKETATRVIPFYQQEIEPLLIADKNILVVAHGNSLRALMMYLEKISPENIVNVNIPTGAPRIYTFSSHLKLVDALYL